MAAIDLSSPKSTGGGGGGNLQMLGGVDITSTVVVVTDTNGNASTLKLSTTLAQFISQLRITTNDSTYLDIEDGSGNNRFTISRDPASQQVNVDFASNPTGSTTIVGAIRTYVDGVNLSEVMTFREDGLVNVVKNLSANNVFEGFLSTAASGTQVVLTFDSVGNHLVTGSGGQTFKLPDATTLPNGTIYYFNNNQSSGAISVNNNSNTLVASIPSGGFSAITLLSNATSAGTWERHEQAPSNVSWSTNTLNYVGSITGATWNGVAIADAYIASAATWNAKQNAITGAATTITTTDLTASRALVSNSSGKVAVATTTSTELGYVNGVTSAIQTQIDSKTNKLITLNRQTSSYTLVAGDADKLVEMNVGTANNLTVPSSTFSAGTQILLSQYGAGQTTIVAGSGMTIRSNGGKLKLNAQYSGATLVFISGTEAYLFGDISA